MKWLLLSWHGYFVERKGKRCGELPLYLFLMVWWEKNCRAFDNKENYVVELNSKFSCIIFGMVHCLYDLGFYSVADFLDWI